MRRGLKALQVGLKLKAIAAVPSFFTVNGIERDMTSTMLGHMLSGRLPEKADRD